MNLIILTAVVAAIAIFAIIFFDLVIEAEWASAIGFGMAALAVFFLILELSFVAAGNIGAAGKSAEYKARYESLSYQQENDLYDNNNDIGKLELYQEIQEYNEKVAKGKALQSDPWVGAFYPDIFDGLELIELGDEDGT